MLLERWLFNFIYVLVDFWETKNICMLERSVSATRNNMLLSLTSSFSLFALQLSKILLTES